MDYIFSLQWRHNGRDGESNYQPRDCVFNRLFRRRSKKTSKLRVTGLFEGNSSVTGEFDDAIMYVLLNESTGFIVLYFVVIKKQFSRDFYDQFTHNLQVCFTNTVAIVNTNSVSLLW